MDKDHKTLIMHYTPVALVDPIFSATMIMSNRTLNCRKVAMLTAMKGMLKEKRIELELKKPFCEALWNMYGRDYRTT